jgi:type IV pilus assembly protein PilA
MIVRKEISRMSRTWPRIFMIFMLTEAVVAAPAFAADPARAQQQAPEKPETVLAEALSAACRQDADSFAGFLTADNATAYRSLPVEERTAFMRRFVLLDDPGRPLLSTSASGHPVVRCEAPGVTSEMRFGETHVRDNLAFIPIQIPMGNEPSRAITFGLVRESGSWKLLSAGLLLLNIPEMAKQWKQEDVKAHEKQAIASLRELASALETYRKDYGKLPETLAALGPAPKNGVSPEAAGLVDADLAAGKKNGYTFRYSLTPLSGNLTEEEAAQAMGFQLAATPDEYGKTGQMSFYLDSTGVLRGADKQGAVASSSDPRIEPG